MKAAVYYETGSPEVFRYEDVTDPVCEPIGVVVDVQVVSIEGGDTLNRLAGAMAGNPHIVGYQCAGVISQVGSGVVDREVGQRVVCTGLHGSHAEKRAVPAALTWVVPDELDLPRAACVPIAVGTADDCLFEFGCLQSGESVLVQAGAGAVGMAAIQLASQAGARVIATASSDEKLARLAEFGLDHGINYTAADFVSVARELTDGRGPDLVVDSVGGRTLQGSIECAAYRGRIISVALRVARISPPMSRCCGPRTRRSLVCSSGRNSSTTRVACTRWSSVISMRWRPAGSTSRSTAPIRSRKPQLRTPTWRAVLRSAAYC
jgi:NADPH2:quinone reductase